ncbi:uncharacterized protein LOC121800311 isoform X2 [Salvia splendens]|uniref:uncharacterized protein LOC121800311 isoform X2 n=1 Tax=Salvia splendens TaxID=180675 RepID=UPI001C25C8DD|nr:uncharacterized protein LOC121800311 isoform X2 [Salvia splendens]
MSISEKLLVIEPQELTFRFELMKNASCTIRLRSNSSRHVAFKVMTTSPEKYFVKPNNGILSPGSTCHVEVTMRAPEEVPPNMECKDKFLIKSVLASPDDTVAKTRKLQQSPNLDRSGGGSSILKGRSSNSTQLGGKNEWLGDNLYMKAVAVLFLSLIFLYLVMRILPVIWSWMFVATFFVIKMAKRLVSDSVEDWVVKTLVYICLHFFTVVFQQRKRSRSGRETGVPVVR